MADQPVTFAELESLAEQVHALQRRERVESPVRLHLASASAYLGAACSEAAIREGLLP